MKITFLFISLIVVTLSSCRMPYEPDIEADQEILVVDALLANRIGASYVKLSTTMPYDATENSPGIEHATVYLTDEAYNRISFAETSAGYYEPVDTFFAGEVNTSYELTVITPDGNIYVSEPETIPEDTEPDSIYAAFDQVEYLTEDYYGKTIKVTEKVCALYYDYLGDSVAPHFRYNANQVVIWAAGQVYYWRIYPDNNLRISNEKFTSSTGNIFKQEVNTTPARKQIAILPFENTTAAVIEYLRFVKLNQYRLNDDSYEYYKSVEAQSDAEGKLFDPILSRVKGNISCVNVPNQTVLGFFEASNLMTKTIVVRVQWLGYEITLKEVFNLPPLPPFGYIKKLDAYWVP